MKHFDRIGRYEVRMQIGRGAMGTVFEGFDPQIGRKVAIKTLRTELFESSQLTDVLARFKREAQSAGRLSHPNIVTIYEYGEEQGTPYIAMEYLQGNELGALLSRGTRFSQDEIAALMSQMLSALAHAHDNGVVHRDLKPANMFVVDNSLKVVDFGIARVEASDLTDTGAMLGTPAYMSPEQCLGTQVDKRSDIFSAGVILYQLLTGDKPFTGSVTTIIQKVLRQDPLPPSDLNPTISAAWDRVVARAIAKKPEARFESGRHFLEALKLAHKAERDFSVSVEVRKGGQQQVATPAATQPRELSTSTTAFHSAPTVTSPGTRSKAAAEPSRYVKTAVFVTLAAVVVGVVLYQWRESERRALESVRIEAEKKLQSETSARAAAEAKAKTEAEARAKAESTAAQALAAAQKEAGIREANAKAEAERRKETEAREAKARAEAKAKVEAELKAAAAARLQAERAAAERAAAEREAAERAAARAAADRAAANRAAAERAVAEQRRLEEERKDLALWDAARGADRVENYRAYLRDSPNGRFRAAAEKRVLDLQGQVDPKRRWYQ